MGKLGRRPILLPLLSPLSELCLAAFASRNNEEERLPRNRMCHGQAAATNGPKHKSLTVPPLNGERPASYNRRPSLFPK